MSHNVKLVGAAPLQQVYLRNSTTVIMLKNVIILDQTNSYIFLLYKYREREETMDCLIHWSPKFYNNVFFSLT